MYQNSIVLLNWPNPGSTNKEYDVDSIVKIKPRIICVSYGLCGASGSDSLINMLVEYEQNSQFIKFKAPPGSNKLLLVNMTSYHLVYSYTLTIGSGYGFTGQTKRLVIYVRKDYMENFASDPVILTLKIFDNY